MAVYDAMSSVTTDGSVLKLSFNPSEVVENLRYERYALQPSAKASMVGKAYYLARPFLGVAVRKHLQRIRLMGWRDITFPRWPVDATVEKLFEQLLGLSLRKHAVDRVPFVWFWPDGFENCVMMTHDVETSRGLDYCSRLMDVDDEHGLKASFQIVPEGRYPVSKSVFDAIRRRGFEANLHDLNHDGRLFRDREMFLERSARINQYAKEYQTEGFRSAILYRNPEWIDTLEFQYDMSSPATAHLDAQQGGCCSVLPFYLGSILELPLTTTQDYSLFHIMNDYSIDLWKRQIQAIRQHHGLVSFIIHPDYVQEAKGHDTYRALLAHLGDLQTAGDIWFARPSEVNAWWRNRSEMNVVRRGNRWVIDGPGSERARIAYASLDGNRLVYDV